MSQRLRWRCFGAWLRLSILPRLPLPVSCDHDDDAGLAVAVASRADMIISGDADLLVLVAYEGIPIIDAANAIALLDG